MTGNDSYRLWRWYNRFLGQIKRNNNKDKQFLKWTKVGPGTSQKIYKWQFKT